MLARAGVVAIIALVTVSGLVAAQGQPVFNVVLDDAPTSPVSVRAGQSTSVQLQVTLHGEEFGCSEATALPVTVDVAGTSARETADAADLDFTVAAGAYANTTVPGSPIAPYQETQPTTVNLQTQSGVQSGYTVRLTVTAAFPGGEFMGCLPQELPSASSDPATITVNVQPDQAPPPAGGGDGGDGGDGGNGGTGNGTDGDGDDDGNGIPTPAAFAPLALALVALAVRRRR